jgi:hypothetical protein
MMGRMTLTDSRTLPASPRADRHRAGVWRDPRLLVGIVLVAASGLAGALLLTGDETVDVWAVRADLAEGQRVDRAALATREVRFADQADADRYVSADQPLPQDATLAREVGAGELLPRAALVTGKPAELLEVPLTVPAESVPSTVRPGSVVDVWVAPGPERGLSDGDGEGGLEATLVLEDVRVVSASRGATALGPATARQVIVGVEAADEGALPEALARLANGSVVLVRQP